MGKIVCPKSTLAIISHFFVHLKLEVLSVDGVI